MHGRWAPQKCWHLVSRITAIRRSRMPGDRRCQPRPRSERGAGTGSDLTLGPGSDLGCSAPIHLHPREHRNHARTRYNVLTPPSAQSGVVIHPGAAPAPMMRESGLQSASLSTFSPHPNVAPQLPAPPTVCGRMPQRKRNVLHVNVCMRECPCCTTTQVGGICRGYQSMLGSGGLSARGTSLSPVCVGVVMNFDTKFCIPVLQS